VFHQINIADRIAAAIAVDKQMRAGLEMLRNVGRGSCVLAVLCYTRNGAKNAVFDFVCNNTERIANEITAAGFAFYSDALPEL
jgi:hypothetical protein